MSEAKKNFQQLIKVLEGLKDDSKPQKKLSKTRTSMKVLKPYMTDEENVCKSFNPNGLAMEALRAEIMRGNWKDATSLLAFLNDHGSNIETLVCIMGLHVIWNNREEVADNLKQFLKVACRPSVYHPEVRLVGALLLINSGLKKEAEDLAYMLVVRRGRPRKVPEAYSLEVDRMLQGYKGALECIRYPRSYEQGTDERRTNALIQLECLFDVESEAPYLFLGLYLQLLSAKKGKAAAKTYALNVSKAQDKELTIQATVNHFIGQNREVLERMVLSSPGDPCAFDLATILLQGRCSDDSGNEDDDTPASADFEGKSACRALSVLANALDFPENYTSVTGWALFWQAVKKVCTIGSRICAEEVQYLYEDRQSWWSRVHFADGLNEAPNLRLLKAACCYVLESEDHPYVRTAMQKDAQQTLQTYIKQIRQRKKTLDAKRDACGKNTPVAQTPTLFYPDSDSESDTEKTVEELELRSLSESEMTIPKIACGFPKHMPSGDLRFRPKINGFNVFSRIRKRLQSKKERALSRKTEVEDPVPSEVIEEDVTISSAGAYSPWPTDGENLSVPEPVVRKRVVRKRKKLTQTLLLKSVARVQRETADGVLEIRPSGNSNSSLVARSPAKSPSPNVLALSPNNVKQQLFSKKLKRTEKHSTHSRKLMDISEDEGESDRSESRTGSLQMSENDDEPVNWSSLQAVSEAGTVEAKSRKHKESINSVQITDEVSDDSSSHWENQRPVKEKKKNSLVSRYNTVLDSIFEDVSAKSNVVRSKDATEEPPVAAKRPEEPGCDDFVRPNSSRHISIKLKTKKEARARFSCPSSPVGFEASFITSVHESSVTSDQDTLSDGIEGSTSSVRYKKKKKKKKWSTLAGRDHLQVSSSESASTEDTIKENLPAVPNEEQKASQVVAKKGEKNEKKSKNKGGDSVEQEGSRGEKAVIVASEESYMSQIPSETQQVGVPKAEKKKKNIIAAESEVGRQNYISYLVDFSSGLEESPVKIERGEANTAQKKKSSYLATMGKLEAPVKQSGSLNTETVCVSARAGRPEAEKGERNLTSESAELEKGNDEKQRAVEVSKVVDVPEEEDDDYDAYISNFVKEFLASPTAPKCSKKSVERTALRISTCTPESSRSVTATKKARRGIASTKVGKATTVSHSSLSIELDDGISLAPENANVGIPSSITFDAGKPVVVAPRKGKRRQRETKARGEQPTQNVKVAEKTAHAVEGKRPGMKLERQLDDTHNAENTRTDGVTGTDSDDEDSAFVSRFVKHFLSNSGTSKQAKEAKSKTSTRHSRKTRSAKSGNSSVISPYESAVRKNKEVTSQNGDCLSPTVTTSAMWTAHFVKGSSKQLASEDASPVEINSRSSSRKKAPPEKTSSSTPLSCIEAPPEEDIQSGSPAGKHNDNRTKGDQGLQQLEGDANHALSDKTGASSDDDKVNDDFWSKYVKDYLGAMKQPKGSEKDTKKRKPISFEKNRTVGKSTSKWTKGAASVASSPSGTKSVVVKSHV